MLGPANHPRQGSMKTRRIITQIFTLAAVAAAIVPASAQASSLLSGYGGPGQGNQAVLGSALLKGPKGKGGGSGGSGYSLSDGASAGTGESSGRDSSAGSAAGGGSGSGTGGGSATGSGHAGATRATGSDRARGSSRRSSRTSRASTIVSAQSFYPAAERVPSAQQGGVLGFSTKGVLYIILAAGALALLAVLTRRLGDTSARAGSGG
jgi:hypothetical protein